MGLSPIERTNGNRQVERQYLGCGENSQVKPLVRIQLSVLNLGVLRDMVNPACNVQAGVQKTERGSNPVAPTPQETVTIT